MSIDKESSGLPEINVHRSTTKVNLGVIAGIVIFLAVAAAAAIWTAGRTAAPDGAAPVATERK